MILWIMNDEAVKETFEWCSYGSLKAPGILKINRSAGFILVKLVPCFNAECGDQTAI